jgi:hypothetical protein
MTQRMFDFQRVASQVMIPAGLQALDAQMIEDHAFQTTLCRLSAYVMTEKLADETKAAEMVTPASWWQHLKDSHGPRWFRRLFPVKRTVCYATVHFEAKGVYPDAPIAMPPGKFGQRVIFEEITAEPWRRQQ